MKNEKRALKQLVKTLDQLQATSRVFRELEEAAANEAGGGQGAAGGAPQATG